MVTNEQIDDFNHVEQLFSYAQQLDFGELHFKFDPKTGLKAIVAIHSTKLGPSFGGCRCIEYPSTSAAIVDALRLAQGMSYKAASVGIPHGGAKAVIMRPKQINDREAYFRAFGRFVNSLGGRYITAKDSGISLEDLDIIAQETQYNASTSEVGNDPSPYTSHGIYRGIKAAAKFQLNHEGVDGLHVALQGVGGVGYHLAKELHKNGAKLSVTDIDQQAVQRCVQEFGAQAVATDKIFQVDCDVFAPCALGAILNDDTIPQLKTTIIAGGANNQLADPVRHAQALLQRGILYAPDYVINSAGLIYAATKYAKGSDELATDKIQQIYDSLMLIFEQAKNENKTTAAVADHIAKQRLIETD